MSRTLNYIALAIVIFSALTNLETIRTFPSWFDEAFFANIAFNLAQGKGLVLDLIPLYFKGEIYLYGPIYFYLQSFLINSFGLQEFIFRLPNLISAYLTIFLLVNILRQHSISRPYWILFVIAATVDVSLNRNLVSGRMDMLAVVFATSALYLINYSSTKIEKSVYIRWLLVGGLSAIAYLITPRILFLLPVVFISGLYKLFFEKHESSSLQKNWLGLGVAILAFTLPIAAWIQYTGGINVYISLFASNTGTSNHIAPSFFRSSFDNIGIGLMVFLSLISYPLIFKDILILGLIATYIIFSLFVNEIGPYAGMIMPFVLATITIIIAKSMWPPVLKYALSSLIIVPGLLLLLLRGTDVYLNSACRDDDEINAMLEQTTQANQKIVTPFKYYFLLEQVDRELVTLEYSKISQDQVINNADLVIADENVSEWLTQIGFKKFTQINCEVRHVPLLPDTFYSRSTFNESFYLPK